MTHEALEIIQIGAAILAILFSGVAIYYNCKAARIMRRLRKDDDHGQP